MLLSMGASSQPGYPLAACCRYAILNSGTLDASRSDRLGGMTLTATRLADGAPATRLMGELVDQSAWVGVLITLHDLGLPLVAAAKRRYWGIGTVMLN